MGLPLQHVEARLENSPLVECQQRIADAARGLGASIPQAESESMAFLIANAMSTRNRDFHDLEHALAISSTRSAIGKLAGLFHDLVYVQIDRARLPELRDLMSPCAPSVHMTLKLTAGLLRDRDIDIVARIFGFAQGKEIGPLNGINEFLSAVCTYRLLKRRLKPRDLLGVVACIEATIPFRAAANSRLCEDLGERIRGAAQALKEKIPAAFIEEVLKASVEVANQDVSGFASSDPGLFVHQSWALLYETNPALQRRFYTLEHYMMAIHKMDSFFNAMNPATVFRRYKNFPAEADYKELSSRAVFNVAVGRQYTAVKLIEVALLAAIADSSGGQVPADYFYGARPRSREARHLRLEDCLPIAEFQLSSLVAAETQRLLIEGRAHRSRFDNKNSHLAEFIISKLSDDSELRNLYAAARDYASGKCSSAALLANFPREILSPVIDALKHVAPARSDALVILLKSVQTSR